MKFGPVIKFISACLIASVANATIMSVDYNITVDGGAETIGGMPGTVADVSLLNPDFSDTDSFGAGYTFDFTGDVLTLTVNLNGLTSLGTAVAWDFSNIDFTNDPTEVITDVTRTGGNGGAALIDDGVDFIFIDTPDESPDGIYSYVFDITTNFSTPAAIPEPSSCALFLVGGLAAWRIRRKRAA
ncbi:MAG: PEP-CTERM sorting domain-containing protein [Planctomycetaceae bacterium]|nr:PEP-CTERM sorting domain-containing protein [Planctomycetaceae bacterium]